MVEMNCKSTSLLGHDQVVPGYKWSGRLHCTSTIGTRPSGLYIERWSLDTSGLAGFTVQALLGHDQVVFIERWSLDISGL